MTPILAQASAQDEALEYFLALALEVTQESARLILAAAAGASSPADALALARRAAEEAGSALAPILEEAVLYALAAGMGRVAKHLPGVPPSAPVQGTPSAATPAASATVQAALSRLPPGMRDAFLAAMPAPPQGPPLPLAPPQLPLVAEALAALRASPLVPRERLESLPEEARRRVMPALLPLAQAGLERVQEAVAHAVAGGEGLPAFRKRLAESLGGESLPRHQVEAAFRTAVGTAYADGMDRLLDTPGVSEMFPFIETLPIRDSRLSGMCALASRAGINGSGIYRRDDPAWARLRPPRHINCRCAQNPLTQSEAARRGVAGGGWVELPAALDRALRQQGR